ncbi:MAG: purine-nucleoside phosphorylase [Fimbriiglobus sp.]
MTSFADFVQACHTEQPQSAIILGSGLTGVAGGVVPRLTLAYQDIPGLVPPTIQGHRGELVLGTFQDRSVLVCYGRVHYYEGHPWDRVLRLVNLLADWGVKKLILTNAAGGLHPSLNPGDIMLLRGQVKLLDADAWRSLTEPNLLYDAKLLAQLQATFPKLIAGIYAGLTGPCYETPAEICALAHCGIDAVGMSTVREAEIAVSRGLAVVGLSCITNKAAGLAEGTLHHSEVESTAKLAVVTLRRIAEQVL